MTEGKPGAEAAGGRDELVGLVQTLVAEGQRIGHAFAQRHGIHGTDVEALIRILVAPAETPMTAGALAAELGLTTGTVTTLLDRLERDGHVRRERDPTDRRRVIVRYAEPGLELAGQFFTPLGRHHRAATAAFTREDLDVVKRYLAATIASYRAYREELDDEMRHRPRPASAGKRSPDDAGA
ncbi:MarR family transcriptional regulator [Kribbella italica]|uniref:DNA-binding MarR family transcriptional regulator n=1 Tax=Kribbella italica TaxID=1540520 RepID=A0A7W9MRV5_9ACTN|nr:DNA-binding MarR family transcriptional regulator [Kribbella italica]